MSPIAVIKDNNTLTPVDTHEIVICYESTTGQIKLLCPIKTGTLLRMGALFWFASLFEGLSLWFFNNKLLATFKSIQQDYNSVQNKLTYKHLIRAEICKKVEKGSYL